MSPLSSLYTWAEAGVARAGLRARHVWTWSNWAEVVFTAAALLTAGLSVAGLLATGAGILWAVAAAALFTAGSTVRATIWNADERFRVDRHLHATREVTVNANGRRIRFRYGVNGWDEIPMSTQDVPEGAPGKSTKEEA